MVTVVTTGGSTLVRLGALKEVKGKDGPLIAIEEMGVVCKVRGVVIGRVGGLGTSVVGVAETGNEGRGVVTDRVGVAAIVRGVAFRG